MYKLNSLQYPDLIDYANTHDCGSVYPLSVAEGIQKGDIFADSVEGYEKVLFWTHSGFAYLSGKMDEYFLEDIYELMLNRTKLNTKRFLLNICFSIQEPKDIWNSLCLKTMNCGK